jgi:DNA polymerase-1
MALGHLCAAVAMIVSSSPLVRAFSSIALAPARANLRFRGGKGAIAGAWRPRQEPCPHWPALSTVASATATPLSGTSEGDVAILIDGTYLLFRSYFAMPPLSDRKGRPTGAVVGLCNQLVKWVLRPSLKASVRVVMVFDSGVPSFRKDLYEPYKANRSAPPDDLSPQFGLARSAVKAFGIPIMSVEGFEADDVIATLARDEGFAGRVDIVSSDKDLSQLVDGRVSLLDLYKGTRMSPSEVEAKWGVPPPLMGDLLALAGDSSDNIPGIPGIGPKTAAKMILEHGSLEALIQSAQSTQGKVGKRVQALLDGVEDVRLSRQLVKLIENVPLAQGLNDIDTYKLHDPEKLETFLQEYDMLELLRRVQALKK